MCHVWLIFQKLVHNSLSNFQTKKHINDLFLRKFSTHHTWSDAKIVTKGYPSDDIIIM